MSTPAIPEGFSEAFLAHRFGVLAVFDLANTQLRNSFLGHNAVDRDIDEFESILASSGETLMISRRIAGDKWAALISGADPSLLFQITKRFQRAQLAEVGWVATARKRFRFSRTRSSVHTSHFHRSLRCAYLPFSASDELATLWNLVTDRVALAQVGQPSDARDGRLFIENSNFESRWRCIDLSSAPRSCPFCDAGDFDWQDGDNSYFGAGGICRKCKANVEFQDSFRLLDDATESTADS